MRIFKSLSLLLFLFVSYSGQAQTTITRQLLKEYPNCSKSFFYPSVLRAMNVERNPDLDQLIRSIEEAAYIQVLKEGANVLNTRFSEMQTQIQKDGFTEMMSMQGPDGKFGLFAHGTEHPDEFVFIKEDAERLILIDIQGELDMALLMKLDQLDFGVLQGVFDKGLSDE